MCFLAPKAENRPVYRENAAKRLEVISLETRKYYLSACFPCGPGPGNGIEIHGAKPKKDAEDVIAIG